MASIEVRQIAEGRSTSESDKDIAKMINDIYLVGEEGLFLPGQLRTNDAEISKYISAGEMFGAYSNDTFIGCVKLQELRPGVVGIGALAVLPKQRRSGVGRILVSFVEEWGRERGFKVAEIGVFVPRHWKHPSKEFLMEWYTKMGYQQVKVECPEDTYPHLKSSFATECDHIVYEKELA